MSKTQELYESVLHSMEDLWDRIVAYAPTLLGALIVLVIGIIISILLGKFAKKIVLFTRVDKLSEKIGLKREVKNVGINLDFATLIGWLVKWFFFIVTFVAVVDILNIEQLTSFLEKLVLYLPNVLVAIVIMGVGLVVGKLFKNAVENSLKGFAVTTRVSTFLGSLAKWSVFIFALMAALVQLGVAADLIQILFTGFVVMLALAGGLAFGLGGREHASKVLDKVSSEIESGKRK